MRSQLFIVLSLVLVHLIGFASCVSAEKTAGHPTSYPVGDCLVVAYSQVGNHYSLVANNSTIVGNDVTVMSDCGGLLEVTEVGGFSVGTDDDLLIISLAHSITSMHISANSSTVMFHNITVFPASEACIGDCEWIERTSIENSKLWYNELYAHLTTFIILYFLTTSVVYKLARNKSDNTIGVLV